MQEGKRNRIEYNYIQRISWEMKKCGIHFSFGMKALIGGPWLRYLIQSTWRRQLKAYGHYRHAIVREIDDSLAQYALRSQSLSEIIDMTQAIDQHRQYVNVLRY